ncbi:MAG: addiction module protein [Betaproteobacteria bacterium]
MASVFEEVVVQARRLSESERMRLVEALLRDLADRAGASAEGVAAAWDAEVERRLDEMESGRVAWVSHEQAMAGAVAAIASARAK